MLREFRVDDDLGLALDEAWQAVIGVVDQRRRMKADHRAAAHTLARADQFDIERHRLGHALDREIAIDLTVRRIGLPESGGDEGRRRELRNIQEARARELRGEAFDRRQD